MQMVAPSQPLGASEACRPLARLRPEAPEAVFRQDPLLPAPDSPACPTHRPRYTFVGTLTPLLCLKLVLEEAVPLPWLRLPKSVPQTLSGQQAGDGGGSRHLPSWPQRPSAIRVESTLLPRCPWELMFGVWHSPWTWHPGALRSAWTRAEGFVCRVSATSRAGVGSPQGCTPRPPGPFTEQRAGGLLVHRWELSRSILARSVIPGSPRKSPAPSSVSGLCTRPSLPPCPTSGQCPGSSKDQ